MKHTGGSMSPFTAWVMLKGLETMDLRVRAQTANAEGIMAAITGHPALSQAIYPGSTDHPQHALVVRQMGKGGTLIAVDLGDQAKAFRFLNALQVVLISNNLGDAKSIATHPATTTHQRLSAEQRAALGITPGMVRLSIGIEDCDDLVADILAALAAV